MAYAILVQTRVQAEDVKALNRVGVSATLTPNGKPYTMGALSKGVFALTAVGTITAATAPKNVWLAYSPEIVVTDGMFKGIDQDPRKFATVAGKPVDMFKPVAGDLIQVTADFFKAAPSTNKIVELDTDGQFKAVATGTASYAGITMKIVEESYIVIATGAIGADRVTAYTMEVVAN